MNMTSGILLIDKPEGVTSFEVVRRARRVLQVRKIGHLGTLDPLATGLLPLCVGEATKLAPFLMPEPKTYRALVRLGEETDTQDATGQVTARNDKWPDPEQVRRAAAGFVGEIEQIPPMYSALHYQGERLYKLARRGETVDLPPRQVTIYRLAVEEVALPLVTMVVTCSQGTYIRTLAADLGTALRCGAHLAALRRLQVGSWSVEEALTLEALEAADASVIRERLIPLADCLPSLRPISVGPEEARQMRQGRSLACPENGLAPGEQVRVMANAELVAVACVRGAAEQALLTPVRVFGGKQQLANRGQGSEVNY